MGYVAYSLGLLLVIEVLALIPAYIFGAIIDTLSSSIVEAVRGQEKDFWVILRGLASDEILKKSLLLALMAFGVSTISNLVGLWKDQMEIDKIDFSVKNRVTRQTLNRLLTRSIGQDRARNSGKTLSIVQTGKSSLEQLASTSIYDVFPSVSKIIVTTVAIFMISWYLGVVTLTGMIVFVIITIMINKRIRPRIKKIRDVNNKLGKDQHEIVRNMTLVKLSSQQSRVEEEFMGRWDDLDDFSVKTWRPYNMLARFRSEVLIFTRFLILSVAILMVMSGEKDVGFIVIAMMWTNHSLGAVGPLGHMQRRLTRMVSDVKKFFEVLDVEESVVVPKNPIRLSPLRGEIEFRNVSFSYARERTEEDDEDSDEDLGSGNPVLENVSFQIAHGEKVAIVGPTGSGKSTIINLLLRTHDPDEGQILIDGVDLRLIDLNEFRSSVGLVEQQIELFHQTLRYNLLFGMNGKGASITDEMIDEVAKQSLIDDFSDRLTDGYDTIIGENGIMLSGGERQRVAIARALIKDPAILVFDEATSSLDVESEELIKRSIDNASRGRTAIVIAHRLSTVVDADRIFVVEKGRITATGTHAELLESSDMYHRLVSKQVSLIG